MSEPELNAHIAEKVAEKVEEVAEVTRQQNHSIKRNVWFSSVVTQLPAWAAAIMIIWKLLTGGVSLGSAGVARAEVINGLPERMDHLETRTTNLETKVGPLTGRITDFEASVNTSLKHNHDDSMAAIFRLGDHTHDVTHILHKVAHE